MHLIQQFALAKWVFAKGLYKYAFELNGAILDVCYPQVLRDEKKQHCRFNVIYIFQES